MNPVMTIKKQTQLLIYKLTTKDKKRLKDVYIKSGPGHKADRMCIMQAISMVTSKHTEPSLETNTYYSDRPLCVSPTLRSYMVMLNDSLITSEQRNSLKKLVPILLNTRPLKARILKSGNITEVATTSPEYKEAEQRRRALLTSMMPYSYRRIYGDKEFRDMVKLIRTAANLYHTPEEGEDLEVITV